MNGGSKKTRTMVKAYLARDKISTQKSPAFMDAGLFSFRDMWLSLFIMTIVMTFATIQNHHKM